MNKKMKMVLSAALVFFGFLYFNEVMAAIEQPSFVTGDGERAIEQSAGRAYQVISGIIASIAAITFLVGVGMFMVGNQDGKKWMINSAIGLLLVGAVSIIYYIAG